MKKTTIFLIKIYKKTLSPVLEQLFGKGCIYNPTCSQYTIDALEKYSFLKAIKISFIRFLSCQNIFSSKKGYFDPVK